MTTRYERDLSERQESSQTMQISDDEAQRWGLTQWRGGPKRVRAFYWAIRNHLAADPIPADANPKPDTDPIRINLLQAFLAWEELEQHCLRVKKEIAMRLVDTKTPLTHTAEQLGVSRPTLYAWQRELEKTDYQPSQLPATWWHYDAGINGDRDNPPEK